MKFHQTVFLLILSIMLAACSEKPQGVLTNAQQQTLDKAKQTEDVLKKANEERLKKIDELTPEQ
jgi:starvation-inducible outer membrane lipoprotein